MVYGDAWVKSPRVATMEHWSSSLSCKLATRPKAAGSRPSRGALAEVDDAVALLTMVQCFKGSPPRERAERVGGRDAAMPSAASCTIDARGKGARCGPAVAQNKIFDGL